MGGCSGKSVSPVSPRKQPARAEEAEQGKTPLLQCLIPEFSIDDDPQTHDYDFSGLVLFQVNIEWLGGGKEVFLSGSFSDWQSIAMPYVEDLEKKEEKFEIPLYLPPGDYQYKFIVDGRWEHDPAKPTIDNDFGTKNNVISIKLSDLMAFKEDLAPDAKKSDGTDRRLWKYRLAPTDATNKIDFEALKKIPFSQEIPKYESKEKRLKPPEMPRYPRLLALSYDELYPALPIPNHVMMNHLYIYRMDGEVLVVSSAYRYETKVVTTLYYTMCLACFKE